jgi:transposase
MEGHLTMSGKERERLKVLARVKRKELTLREAAELLGVSYRQSRRWYKRQQELGERGLVHRSRGRPSNRGHKAEFKALILARYQQRYADFGPTLAAEKLAAEGYAVDHETLRGWLLTAGLWQKRRKRGKHRSWRERRPHFGELVQLDGSHHRWFEARGERSCLMTLIDDATSIRLSRLYEEETSLGAMEVLWRWIERHGLPAALYVDRKNVYVVDEKTQARAAESGEEVLTQFGRACKQLGIKLITAHSPQAKGRVERSHATYQDRLVKELRLADISTIAATNEVLDSGYDQALSDRFAVPPRAAADYHRAAKGLDLAAIFCIEEQRSASADWIVRFQNQFFQLPPPRQQRSGRRLVQVQRYLDGTLHFRYQGRELTYTVLSARPQPKARQKVTTGQSSREKYVPAANHPWRKYANRDSSLRS